MYTIFEIYNNIPYNPELNVDFGYSCFVKEPGILFDAGAKGDVLLCNLERLGISLDRIRSLVLSHDHWDHNGGIKAVLDENPEITCYCPKGTSAETISALERGAGCVVTEGWHEISPGIFLTGPIESVFSGTSIYEQSLVLDSGKGLFLITGCSHPHISRILDCVRERGPVTGVIGGFHDVDEADIRSLEGLDYISPSHCTTAIEAIAGEFGDKFIRSGAGFIHRI
ncbi:MBL fold metallo-hydrolase [Methanolacinia paynteri]|uniref:MBL fold metallo-hydrolase n=1 Tax=Methanolacinia paynteri TaxID=230356 RepID=UPI00064E4DEC|nr:MBL fold metallo-hydrolase [Methanolacinia paynteri]